MGVFVGPPDGKDLTNSIGGGMVVKIRDGDTAGAYSVHDNTIPPGSAGPRPHIHRRHEETFYVLEARDAFELASLGSAEEPLSPSRFANAE